MGVERHHQRRSRVIEDGVEKGMRRGKGGEGGGWPWEGGKTLGGRNGGMSVYEIDLVRGG